MLKQSIFQSELLVSVSQFHALFPAHDGRQLYLIDVPPEKMDALKRRLHDVLGEWGFRATPSPVILNRFIDVQNTYLAMFLILGGLGLLLGTLGMLAVLMRNAMERRREFAVMQSMGFPARVLARLLGLENTGLLLAGIAGGTLAALIAFVPQARSARSDVNTVALLGVLIAIYVVGSVCVAAAARVAVSGPLLENLREE
jgi:ABC-type antimicrobial peptide transport system permease subunit